MWSHHLLSLVCCFVLLQFAPSYSDYVLYSDGGPADNVKRKKYRGQKGAASSKRGHLSGVPTVRCCKERQQLHPLLWIRSVLHANVKMRGPASHGTGAVYDLL